MNDPYYCPSPMQIRERAAMERYMREHAWSERVIVSIMMHDNPLIAEVQTLIASHGPHQAYQQIYNRVTFDGEAFLDGIRS